MKSILIVFSVLILFNACDSKAQEPLVLNSQAPTFKAKSESGQKMNLSELIARGPVILTFYRGAWCQHCNKHMGYLQDSLHFITDLGATLIAITPEKGMEVDKTRKKTGAEFSIIPDENNTIMDKYKVTWHMNPVKHFFWAISGINLHKSNGNRRRALPVPATYIIDEDGKIYYRFFDEDHTKRMWATDMIQVLEKYNQEKNLK